MKLHFFCVAFVCVVANFISRSPMTSLSHKGLVTFYTTVEWSIPNSPLSPLINKWVRIENKFPIIPLYSAWSIKPWLIWGGGGVDCFFDIYDPVGGWPQNVVQQETREPYHILTSEIHYCTNPRQYGIYLFYMMKK